MTKKELNKEVRRIKKSYSEVCQNIERTKRELKEKYPFIEFNDSEYSRAKVIIVLKLYREDYTETLFYSSPESLAYHGGLIHNLDKVRYVLHNFEIVY